jgi:structure-specific recognition protein 1
MVQAYWNRAARGYEVKIYTRDAGISQFDGFQEIDLERLKKVFQSWLGIHLETREHSTRGWNWGKAEFGKAELSFNVQSRSAFEIPYSEILNTNLAGKNEVAVEFSLPGEDGADTGTNGHLGGARAPGKKAGGAKDQLMEMRFYIPGTTAAAKGKKEDGNESSDGGDEVEEQNAANLFYETLVDKAEIGDVAGDTYATFLDILHLTPRFVVFLSRVTQAANTSTEGASTSTCTRSRSDCEARHMTTRSSTMMSRSSCCCQSQMTNTCSSPLGSTRHFVKVRPAIRSS